MAGLGPADATLIPPLVSQRLETGRWWLRTARHPAAGEVNAAGTFDGFYDTSDTFDRTYERIVEALIAEAVEHGEVGYVVPGSPLVLERAVELLAAAADRGEIVLEVLPAMSFLDLAWAALRVDPVTVGVRLVDGHRFAVEAAGQRGPLLVAHTHSNEVLSDIKLAVLDELAADPGGEVWVLSHLGLPTQALTPTTWAELDRGDPPDHLTSLWVPTLASPVAASLQALAEVLVASDSGPLGDADGRWRHSPETWRLAADRVDAALTGLDIAGGDGIDELEASLGAALGEVGRIGRRAERQGWFNLADVAAEAALRSK